jgi:hypothetical protein
MLAGFGAGSWEAEKADTICSGGGISLSVRVVLLSDIPIDQ